MFIFRELEYLFFFFLESLAYFQFLKKTKRDKQIQTVKWKMSFPPHPLALCKSVLGYGIYLKFLFLVQN